MLEIYNFDNESFEWSYIVYHAAPGHGEFEDVTDEHLQGQAYATEQEILVPAGGVGDAQGSFMMLCCWYIFLLIGGRTASLISYSVR